MSPFTYLLLEGEKVEMEVHPDEINTVAVSLDDESIIYAVAGACAERKLLHCQMIFDLSSIGDVEESKSIASIHTGDESLAA